MKPGRYFPRVALVSASGDPLRYLPGEAARALVSGGTAEPRPTQGRIREIVLVSPASTHAERIGPATAPAPGGVKFTRWVQLDESATRVIEHHPRCLWV